jgi:hypothetical protein
VVLVLLGSSAMAQTSGDITYDVDQTIGSGTVIGQIVTNGALGVLTQADIVSWHLNLNGVGASTTLTSAGGQSGILLVGRDLTATSQNLLFNYSGTDQGYLAFQASNPGFYSGQKYWCNNTNWYGCATGASVVPQSYSDSSAQYATSVAGNQIIATAAGPSLAELLQSFEALVYARTAQMLINMLQSQLLLGLDEQVSCSNCGGTDLNIGSENLAGHGRYALSPEWTLLGGGDFGQYQQRGADVVFNGGVAAAIQYDPAGFGSSRPYATAGITAAIQDIRYRRNYDNGGAVATESGSTHGHDLSTYLQVGWVDRITPRDEAAAFVSYARTWQSVGGYSEQGDGDSLSATVPGGTDTLNIAGLNAQYTHLFWGMLEADLNGGVERVFDPHSGLQATVGGTAVNGTQSNFVYYEVGGRLGVRLPHRLTLDLYVNGILAPSAIGSSAHGGFGVRWLF